MKGNPYESPLTLGKNDSIPEPFTSDRNKLRAVVLLCFYVLMAGNGAIQVLPPQGGMVRILIAVMAASLVAYWCVDGARIVGRPIVQSVHWILFVTWPLAVPVYLVCSRGLRGIALIILHGIGLIAVAGTASHLAGYSACGRLWFGRFGR
jgi:hypothetical protein